MLSKNLDNKQKSVRATVTARTVIIAAVIMLALATGFARAGEAQTFNDIYNFKAVGVQGIYPEGKLLIDSEGDLYGTTSAGGTYGAGTVFKLNAAGTATTYMPFKGWRTARNRPLA